MAEDIFDELNAASCKPAAINIASQAHIHKNSNAGTNLHNLWNTNKKRLITVIDRTNFVSIVIGSWEISLLLF